MYIVMLHTKEFLHMQKHELHIKPQEENKEQAQVHNFTGIYLTKITFLKGTRKNNNNKNENLAY